MSLVAGALKVSRRQNAISREEVSMATLEAGTTPTAATNRHRHIVQTWVPKENTYPRKYWSYCILGNFGMSFDEEIIHW